MLATGKYSREHTLHFLGGTKFKASDAPLMLSDAYRDNARLNTENRFVARVASADTQSFLQLDFGMDVEVLSYRDEAHVVLTEPNNDYWISQVILHPTVEFVTSLQASAAGAHLVTRAGARTLLHRSVDKSKVTVNSA